MKSQNRKAKMKYLRRTLNIRIIYNITFAILFITTLGISTAHADNSSYPNCTGGGTPDIILNLPATINIATLPANTPTITPVTDWFSVSALSYTGCKAISGNNIAYQAALAGSGGPNPSHNDNGMSYDIYPFVSGIGIIMSVQNIESGNSPAPLRNGNTRVNLPITNNGNFNTIYRARLIRYNLTTNSGEIYIPQRYLIHGQDWMYNYNSASGAYTHVQRLYTSPTTIKIQTASCTLNTSNINVQLPNMLPSQFPSVGTTNGTTPFNISINCPSPVNTYMTITDNSAPTSTSDIISATNDSSAQGLGIQIRKNGLPISLGPDSSMAGNTNQFLIGNNMSGNQIIPMTANYIRTSDINVGTIRAIATFTMSYQ
ncbi:fimbrial protein [Aquitalea aquatilis]|uniref:fimbrial protein n=1 Tax=Aquitalea aquatilis TaxID=1537400 RepID=UPI0010BDC3CB|nr:fimbrial protein [Aquitalea aquatilis]